MSSLGQEIRDVLDQAIPGAFAAAGGFVTRWLVIAEAVDADGERCLWMHTSSDLRPWDTIGMLRFGTALEENAFGHIHDDPDSADDTDDEGFADK